MIKLNYFHIENTKGDPEIFEFPEIGFLHSHIDKMANLKKSKDAKYGFYAPDRVYVFTWDDIVEDDQYTPEIIITERIGFIADILSKNYFFGLDLIKDFHLQEYASFEEAYKVALSMKEPSPLCYDNNP